MANQLAIIVARYRTSVWQPHSRMLLNTGPFFFRKVAEAEARTRAELQLKIAQLQTREEELSTECSEVRLYIVI